MSGKQQLDVRDSTLSALKISCPSAEVLDSPHSPPSPSTVSSMDILQIDNPFVEADAEWSDEEELIPKNRNKRPYNPSPEQKSATRRDRLTVPGEDYGDDSSREHSPSPSRSPVIALNGSPVVPPKSPSRPEIRPGSTQEDLVERFYQVTRERDALRRELQRKTTHGPPRDSMLLYKSEEKTLMEDLKALRHSIRNWSEEYFSGIPRTSQKRPHLYSSKELFHHLSDNYQAYLKHPRDRPLLIQAYLWSKLQRRIFSNLQKGCGYVWAGRLGDRKLRPIVDTLRKAVKNEEDAEQYHRWRAMTVNLLVPQVEGKWRPNFDAGPILKWISKFCSRIRRKLRPFSTESLRYGKDQLRTIVSAAVALDLKMKRQRADYRFVTFTGGKAGQEYGFGFYESEMEDVDESETSRRVELALAPALERCGNANGYVFDQSFMLMKAEVSCRRLEKRVPRGPRGKKGSGKRFW